VKCHECSHSDSRVIESRDLDNAATIRRRRQCLGCGARFTTYERAELPMVMVIKRDGRRQPFCRDKLAAGVLQAVGKRPGLLLSAEDLINDIERHIRSLQEAEIDSTQIGEMVLAGLKELDDVAYLRFASVYCGFTKAAHLEAELRKLRQQPLAA